MPEFGSHFRPPLQPPVRHWVGPGAPLLKSQPVRPQMRPDFQLLGTEKETF